MARPRTFDEAEVLEGAVDLFRERGYEGTSVPELTERLGICRQSLYTAFGDKRGLYLRALERYGEREVDAKLALLEAEGSPLENVRTLIRGFAAMATSCPSEGCMTVTALVESRDLLRQITDNLPVLIAFIDENLGYHGNDRLVYAATKQLIAERLLQHVSDGALGVGDDDV